MIYVKMLCIIFMFQILVNISRQSTDFKAGRGQIDNRHKRNALKNGPVKMDINKLCSLQPNGTAILPVDPNICTRLYISCQNYTSSLKRCQEATFYLNPSTLKCEDVSQVEICRDFHNSHKHSTVRPESSADSTTAFPPPPVWTSDIIDGATSYCRSKQNWNAQHCDDFDKCCKLHCYGNAAEPTCSSSSENATAIYQDQAFCRCTHQTYLSNSNITKSCMHSDDCVTFHMCCLLEGCPSTYVRCESSTYDKKPTKGVCFC